MISYREKEMMVAMKYMADHTSRFAETAVEASLCMFSGKNIDGTVEILPEVTSFEDIIRNARENGYDTSIGIEELLSPEELKRLEEEYESIDNEFSELTKLNKMDIGFVVIAVALQLLRQVLQPKLDFESFTDLKNRQDHTQTAKEAKKYFDKEKADKILEKAQKDAVKASRYYFATISEVADISYVPYDVVNGTAKFSVGLNGKNHRAKTLGHDPYLGYFFGICNILTNTMSLGKDNLFRTLHIGKDVSGRRAAIAEADLLLMLKHSFERFKESKETIVLAFLKQKYHIESDELSKEGLPLPFLQLLFDTDVITALCESGIDYAKLNFFGTVGEQAILDEFINFIISVAHRIYIICEENKQLGKEKLISKDEIIGSLKKNQTINEVRTRKIILISDSIATYINAKVIVGVEAAAILTENAELAKKGLKYIDLGGYITTIIHLISDNRFIAKVKKDFVNQAVDQNFREKMEELLSE